MHITARPNPQLDKVSYYFGGRYIGYSKVFDGDVFYKSSRLRDFLNNHISLRPYGVKKYMAIVDDTE
jgi:hypothetical protein